MTSRLQQIKFQNTNSRWGIHSMTMTLLLNFITAGLRQDIYERVLRVCVCVSLFIHWAQKKFMDTLYVAGIQVFPKSETKENLFFMDSVDWPLFSLQYLHLKYYDKRLALKPSSLLRCLLVLLTIKMGVPQFSISWEKSFPTFSWPSSFPPTKPVNFKYHSKVVGWWPGKFLLLCYPVNGPSV